VAAGPVVLGAFEISAIIVMNIDLKLIHPQWIGAWILVLIFF
jgi:hypothetical protein